MKLQGQLWQPLPPKENSPRCEKCGGSGMRRSNFTPGRVVLCECKVEGKALAPLPPQQQVHSESCSQHISRDELDRRSRLTAATKRGLRDFKKYPLESWENVAPARQFQAPDLAKNPAPAGEVDVKDAAAGDTLPHEANFGRRSPVEEQMARRRYQRGSLLLIGKRQKQWQLRYREDVIRDGKRVRVARKLLLGTTAEYPTRKLAQRAAEERLREINSIAYRPTRDGSFARFAEEWQRDVLSQKKYSTQTTERSRIKNHLLPVFGDLQVKEIEPALVQRFVAGAGLNTKSTRNCIATLRMMWQSARAWHYTSTDWFEGVTLPEYVKPEAPHFTLSEMQRIIATAEEPFKTFYLLAAETGMRLGELCALRVGALHLGVGVIIVRHSSWHGRVSSTKSRRPRVFRLSPNLVRRLTDHIAPVADNPDAFVFRSKHGTPWIGDDVIKRNLKPLLAELGIKQGVEGVGLHAFRHGNATLMDSERTPLKVRQDRLGHVDGEQITLGIYTHAESDDHQAVAAKLGDLLAPVEKKPLETMEPASERAM